MWGQRRGRGAQGSGRGGCWGRSRGDLKENEVHYACWERVAVQARGGSQGGLLVTGHHLSPATYNFQALKWGLEAQLVLGFSLLSVVAPGYGHPLLCSCDEGF